MTAVVRPDDGIPYACTTTRHFLIADSKPMDKTSNASTTRVPRLITLPRALALLCAALLCTEACSATAASKPAPAPTQARPAATASAQAHIILYNINSDGPYYRAVVTGTIGDYGPAVAVYPNGKVDPAHNSEMELKLQDGSFRLNIAGIEKTFFAHVEAQPVSSASCSHFESFASTVPVVAGSGTDAYRSITGSFDMTVTADEVQSKPCTPPTGKPPLWEVIVLAGSGTVTT
jgi:hypothetical protein